MPVPISHFLQGGEMLVGDLVAGLRTINGIENDYQFDFPGTGVKDSAGNYLFRWIPGSGVNTNYVKVTSASSTNPAQIAAAGGDLNVNLEINAQGTGHGYFGGTGAMGVPFGTTLQQPAGFAGGLRYNTDTDFMEYWDVGANMWVDIINGAALAGLTYITETDETADLPNSFRLVGTSNRLTATYAANVATLDIAATYVGQTSITTLGTISTGVWHGTAVDETHGGTNQTSYALGDTLYASAANTLSKLSGNTTAVKQYLSQTGTGAVSAAPVWATVSGGDITGAALTEVSDTNVTLTLGGTPATALLRAASITAGWAGQLALGRGGSNANLTAVNGGIVYSTATAMAISAAGSTGQVLQSNGAAAPTWSTPTYPSASGAAGKIIRSDGTNNIYSTATFADTYSASNLLYSNGANAVTGLATANSATLVTSSTGVPAWSATMTNGQILIGSTGATPTPATLTQGTGVTITNGAGTITISATGSGGTVTNVTGVSPIASTGGTTPAISLNGTATAGQVLQSVTATTTAYSTPTYPSASGSAGKVLRADGTNNVYSTATFADTYTASNLLYSNGANTVTGLATANNGVLVTNGSGVPSISSTLPSAVLANISGRLVGFRVFTSGTAATYTPTNSTVNNILIEAVGGGGAGGGCFSAGGGAFSAAGGGGAGGFVSIFLTGIGSSYTGTYSIGNGGSPSAAGNHPGGNGGDTTYSDGIGTSITAGGGGGGGGDGGSSSAHCVSGGTSGTTSGGSRGSQGGAGSPGVALNTSNVMGGNGGMSYYAGGSLGIVNSNAQGNVSNSYGGGGSGCAIPNANDNKAGGSGAAGIIIIWEFT